MLQQYAGLPGRARLVATDPGSLALLEKYYGVLRTSKYPRGLRTEYYVTCLFVHPVESSIFMVPSLKPKTIHLLFVSLLQTKNFSLAVLYICILQTKNIPHSRLSYITS